MISPTVILYFEPPWLVTWVNRVGCIWTGLSSSAITAPIPIHVCFNQLSTPKYHFIYMISVWLCKSGWTEWESHMYVGWLYAYINVHHTCHSIKNYYWYIFAVQSYLWCLQGPPSKASEVYYRNTKLQSESTTKLYNISWTDSYYHIWRGVLLVFAYLRRQHLWILQTPSLMAARGSLTKEMTIKGYLLTSCTEKK